MCLGVPGMVTEITDETWGMAKVDIGGISRDVCLQLVPGTGVGAWVLVHAGFAIQEIDEHEAEETLKLMNEMMGGTALEPLELDDLPAR
jgi:hydrogenase expression/formation protein HypC